MAIPRSVPPEIREMDELRQRLDSQLNAYLNSPTPAARLLNKPPPKEDMDRIRELARVAPPRLNPVAQSIWERNRNWVNFVLVRYIEQLKCFEETGYRHRLYTPQMLGKSAPPVTGTEQTPAQQAQRRVNRMLHGVKEGEEIPADAVKGDLAPMSASAPQQGGGAVASAAPAAAPAAAGATPPADGVRRIQRKVIIKRIIKKKADGTQEVIEQRTVVEVPLDGPPVGAGAAAKAPPSVPPAQAPARAPAAVARPVPKPAPAKPVDKELDDFFKKYNLK